MGRLALPLATLLIAVAVTLSSMVPADMARVTGGINRCEALIARYPPGETRYVAGTVQVLKGDVVWVPDPYDRGALHDMLPTQVVAEQIVGFGDRYNFDLRPGHYVLNLVVAPAGNAAHQYVEVTLNPGDDRVIDIPNTCI
jgi:hypothetical protein